MVVVRLTPLETRGLASVQKEFRSAPVGKTAAEIRKLRKDQRLVWHDGLRLTTEFEAGQLIGYFAFSPHYFTSKEHAAKSPGKHLYLVPHGDGYRAMLNPSLALQEAGYMGVYVNTKTYGTGCPNSSMTAPRAVEPFWIGGQKKITPKKAIDEVLDATAKPVVIAKPAGAAKVPKLKYEKANVGCSFYTNDHSIEPAFHPDNHDAMEIGDVLAVVNWNCRSLRNALTKAKTYLPFEIGCYDIVVLTETQSDLAGLMKHARFNMCVSKYPWSFWNNCLSTGSPGKQGFGGVGVLCRKRPMAVQYGFGSLDEEKEGRVTVIRWKDATLVAVYAPASLTDGTPEHVFFYERLCKLVAKERERCPTFVVGDLNVPLQFADVSHAQPWLKGAARLYGGDRENLQNLITTNKLTIPGSLNPRLPIKGTVLA
jgi:exonuclease III